jgi:ribosomal protein S18 acetylase RimI-like enzyme
VSNYQIHTLTPEYLPQVMALQEAYRQCYPQATVIPGEVYLSPGFEAGANIFCAVDDNGCLRGYAPLLPNLTAEPGPPNVIWTEVKADPALAGLREIKDLLFERVVARAREIARSSPEKPTQLTFQYHPSESPSVEYVLSKGCAYTATVFRMMRDLSAEIPAVPCPDGIEVRNWRMETQMEQEEYVEARNEAFPDSPVSLADWQSFLQSGFWREGCAVTALDGPEIAGCVAAYCDDALSQYTGTKAGITEYIFVRSKWRGRGIAAHLISRSLRFLQERGRDAAYLEVKASNENALALYCRLGYQVIGETRLYALEV